MLKNVETKLYIFMLNTLFSVYVSGLEIGVTLTAVRDEVENIVEPMITRAVTVGHIPGVRVLGRSAFDYVAPKICPFNFNNN
jgi:hypothetical protein